VKINAQAFKPDQKSKSQQKERLREKRVQREERGREMLTIAAVFFCPPSLFSMRCSSLVNQVVAENEKVTLELKS
jgi:hypothetical protein